MSALEVRQWSAAEFSQNQNLWQQLLQQSNADPLFMSWHWHSQWWQRFATKNQFKLYLLACYRGQDLVGLAPLYVHKASLKYGPSFTRLEFIGSCYRQELGIRAEYQGFICQKEDEAIYRALWDHVFNKLDWQEAYIPDLVADKTCYRIFTQQPSFNSSYRRVEMEQPTYSIDTSEKSFEDYLQTLGKNSRLKLYNRRKLLAKQGEIKLLNADLNRFEEIINQLNRLHLERWGGLCFNQSNALFIYNLLRESSSQQSLMSFLYLDDRLLSVMLNLQYKDRVYNIQLGFIEDFDRKISLGTLHLGYAIEAAFKAPDIKAFDLLAGEGKNDNYKQRIAQIDSELISTQIIRSPWLKAVYASYDHSRRLKHHFNRPKNKS